MHKVKLKFRPAEESDLLTLLKLLDEGGLSSMHCPREGQAIPSSTFKAFREITKSPDNQLIVAELSGQTVGMMQLTYIPGISYQGSWRLLIEGIRVKTEFRNQGIGRSMIEWAIDQARENKCRLIQLTSDKRRENAARFYHSLGFKASHQGFKLFLPSG